LKFRGASAWPLFRSYRPGYMPWFVTTAEARLLKYALEQTLEVAPRVKADPDILNAGDENGDDEIYLVRVPLKEGDGLVWEDRLMRVPPPERESVAAAPDVEALGQLKQLPQRPFEVEIDFFSLPTGIGDKGERPYRPYMLMMADAKSGMIVGFEMMRPEPSLTEMHGQIPSKIAEWFTQAGVIPERITARSELLLELLVPSAATLNISLYQSDELPSIDEAANSMLGWMMGGGL